MKKTISMILTLCLLLGLVGGCGSVQEEDTGQKKEADVSFDGDHIVVTYPVTSGCVTDDLEEVTEAINEITREKIGVEVEFMVVDATTTGTTYPIMLTEGQEIDLMLLNFENINNYIDSGFLRGLDDLLAIEGKDIKAISEERYDLAEGARIGGTTYGLQIPGEGRGSGGALWIYQRYLDEIGVTWDPDHIYSYDELTEIFAALKEKYTDSYPLGQITAQYDFTPTSLFVGAKAGAGGDEKTGVISEDSPGVLVDYYEQDYYTDFLKQMRQWYLDGYIYPDAAYTSLSSWELMSEGMILTIPSSSSPGMYTKEVFGEDIVPLRMTEVTYGPASSTGIFWTIPKSSTKAQAAMKFLDLMYSDEEIINLLAWGIEGEHYVVVDAAKGVIDYPDGVDASSVTYLSALGYYGDQTKKYSMDYDSYSEQRMEYISQAKPIGLEYEGFTFDTSEVSVELEQIQEVLDTYEPLLECGCVDYLTTYGSFISRLKAAGIDTVIAEKQRQLDAWLDEQ